MCLERLQGNQIERRAMISSLAASRVSPQQPATPIHEHIVQFYESEEYLSQVVGRFLAEGCEVGEPNLVVASKPHWRSFVRELERLGFDTERALDSARLTFVDASECLSKFIVNTVPQWNLFYANVDELFEGIQSRTGAARIRAYGEMVDLLCRQGNQHGAIQLEEFWNKLAKTRSFSLFCAYRMGNFHRESHASEFDRICSAHSRVFPTEQFSRPPNAEDQALYVAHLEQRARALESEIREHKELERALCEALAARRAAEEALEASQQDLADFLENAVEGVHALGPDGVILWANRAEMELLGFAKQEFIGHHIAEFHADADVIEDILRRLSRNETLTDIETRLRCKDGSVKHVLIHANACFKRGQFVHSRWFTRDTTERKRFEHELRQKNEELARIDRIRGMLAGALGHDLRIPLSVISTTAGLLARRAQSENVAKPASRILKSADRMTRMIDQLLDFTSIRQGKGLVLDKRRTDLNEICRMVIDELDAGAADRAWFVASGDCVGQWDGDRLAQVFSNLLGNALRHGDLNLDVRIRLDGTQPETVSLEVRNTGVIPPDLLSVLFEPFKIALSKRQDGYRGLGLGLFISRQIVSAHGGTIDATSSAMQGTRYIVRLPRNLI
jgi:PAS domain S-box-containing protein